MKNVRERGRNYDTHTHRERERERRVRRDVGKLREKLREKEDEVERLDFTDRCMRNYVSKIYIKYNIQKKN